MTRPRGVDRLALLMTAGVFVLLSLRPLYIAHLRERMRVEQPQAWASLTTNGSFKVLLPHLLTMRYRDEVLYSSCVRQIVLHGLPRNPWWPGEGLGGWIQNSIALYLLAVPAFLTGGDMNRAWLVSVAVIGALWFYLFYRVFLGWSGKKEVAAPLALFSTLFPDLYFWLLDVNFSVSVNLERYAAVFFQSNGELRPHFHRLAFPFLSVLLLCLNYVGAWKLSCQAGRKPVAAALLGACFGLMAWVHPFEFAFGMATLMTFTAYAWLPPAEPVRRWNLSVAFAAALAVGLPCAAGVSLSVPADLWREHLEFLDAVYSRRPYLITVVHLLFAGAGLWALSRESDPARRNAWRLLISAQLAVFMCRNVHVVMGFHVQPFHYIPAGSFMGCLMLFLYGAGRLAAARRWTPAAGMAATLAVAGWGLANEKATAESLYRVFGLPRATEQAFVWASERLPEDSLLLTLSMMTNESIPLYSRSRPATSPLSFVTSPFYGDDVLRATARVLKTSRADADRFIAERWPPPSVAAALRAQVTVEQRTASHLDPKKLEPVEWFTSHHREYLDDKLVLKHQDRLRALVKEVEPLKPPFYLWVDAADEHLLTQDPEKFGGRAVYRSDGVVIYEFEARGS